MKERFNSACSENCSGDRLYRIFFWLLAIGSLLVFFWGIWSIPLLTHNEGRRLVVLREMMANNSWLIPTMNGQVYLEKPPLFYWSGAPFALLADSTAEWVLRLPSGISAMCLVWMLVLGLKEQIGRWAALFGVLILITSSFFTAQARLAELEMLLTFCVFSSLLFYFNYIQHGGRSRLYGAYALIGLAFLTKGPVALLFFLPPILCYGLMTRDRTALKGLSDWRGWLLFAAVAFPWFLYINVKLQRAPLLSVISREMSDKIAGGESEPFYFYLQALAKGFVPWILVLLWKPRQQFKKLFATDAGRFFGLATLLPLILFSLMAFKRDKYILPLYPALAVWLGMALANVLEQVKQRRQSVTLVLTAFSALLIGGFIVYYAAIQAHTMSYRYSAFPPFAARLDRLRGNVPVYFFKEETIQLVYYYGKPIPVMQKEGLEKMLAEGKPFLLLATDKRIMDAMAPGVCLLESIKPFGETNKVLHIAASGPLCRPAAPGTLSS
ncbi:Alg9-like mannosyltransferase family protein [Syntrophus gentianae]|uniref:Alg9-like mannosyltransferase family protein n=1 Tax=Syntrophus gentianae TaxID=43775 RepID=A0A1H7UDG8_9BACT|nr:glycosyltransferase family 39 protein [Syntrophus gentianae]SEL94859.1 Alg9-like mannosyltransferase family protein [Syntrophus gentianae]